MREITPALAWEQFATRATPRRATNAAGATTWLNWTQYPDHGPDETILGDVRSKRVLELGSGSGSNLAHLATLGAHCTGVDIAPSRAAAAEQRWGRGPELEFVTQDAVTYLEKSRDDFDIVISIFGATWFTDPEVLLPLIRERLTPGGLLAFSHNDQPDGPGEQDRAIRKWNLPGRRWAELLLAAGFATATFEIVPPPNLDLPGTLLIRGTAPSS
ncbi:class I SAM-dependent methyltransferase [Lentzea sp. HUAS12]|uniref:class I SAM-dependent methyltransferase n=1 Tax=Lentzea sp. HUAS12 TaxID=2951806 RepID=UPI0020A15CE1|nr:class I SAM-dependent methyltransferase [Lentzea sp. HUAS12]USX56447.1 class I SAM-dependent methyltransferase [Lentzea sp. HUAS12]